MSAGVCSEASWLAHSYGDPAPFPWWSRLGPPVTVTHSLSDAEGKATHQDPVHDALYNHWWSGPAEQRAACRGRPDPRLTGQGCWVVKPAMCSQSAPHHHRAQRAASQKSTPCKGTPSIHLTQGPGRISGDDLTELLAVKSSAPNVWLAMPWEKTHIKTCIKI